MSDEKISGGAAPHVQTHVNASIRHAFERKFGVLDANFLCQSLSMLEPRAAITLPETATVDEALDVLRKNKVGCVLLVDSSGALSGIFSERDCVLKVVQDYENNRRRPIAEFMTRDPVCEAPETSIAFALNLMSQGGFRHVPIVSADRHPLGMISVKDVVDFIVTSFIDDIMAFSPENME